MTACSPYPLSLPPSHLPVRINLLKSEGHRNFLDFVKLNSLDGGGGIADSLTTSVIISIACRKGCERGWGLGETWAVEHVGIVQHGRLRSGHVSLWLRVNALQLVSSFLISLSVSSQMVRKLCILNLPATHAHTQELTLDLSCSCFLTGAGSAGIVSYTEIEILK